MACAALSPEPVGPVSVQSGLELCQRLNSLSLVGNASSPPLTAGTGAPSLAKAGPTAPGVTAVVPLGQQAEPHKRGRPGGSVLAGPSPTPHCTLTSPPVWTVYCTRGPSPSTPLNFRNGEGELRGERGLRMYGGMKARGRPDGPSLVAAAAGTTSVPFERWPGRCDGPRGPHGLELPGAVRTPYTLALKLPSTLTG